MIGLSYQVLNVETEGLKCQINVVPTIASVVECYILLLPWAPEHFKQCFPNEKPYSSQAHIESLVSATVQSSKITSLLKFNTARRRGSLNIGREPFGLVPTLTFFILRRRGSEERECVPLSFPISVEKFLFPIPAIKKLTKRVIEHLCDKLIYMPLHCLIFTFISCEPS